MSRVMWRERGRGAKSGWSARRTMNRNVELTQDALDALPLGRFDDGARRTLRRGENRRTWDGVDGSERENGRVVIIQRSLVLAMMLQEAVRRHMAVNHDLGVSMVLAFVNVFWCGERQQADRQAQRACEHLRQPHREDRMRRRPNPATPTSAKANCPCDCPHELTNAASRANASQVAPSPMLRGVKDLHARTQMAERLIDD